MKNFLLSIFLLISFFATAQEPGGIPTQSYQGKWSHFEQYLSVGKGLFAPTRDTSWKPYRAGALQSWQGSFWGYDGGKWVLVGSGASEGWISFNQQHFTGNGTDAAPMDIYGYYTIEQVDSAINAHTPRRVTSAQRDALTNVQEGTDIYNLDLHKKQVKTASAWETITSQ